MTVKRQVNFNSGSERCAADLYLPEGVEAPPVVVMGHGLGGLRSFRLPAFAERFVARGLAVFAFDYRHWGDSGGEPRQLLSPRRQLEDWHAALACVRGLAVVDGSRVGVWGTSFGGAHVIHVAAQDHAIRAVVAQVPAADTASAAAAFGVGYLLQATALGVADLLGSLVGMRALYLPLVGRPGDRAIMHTPECWEGYMSLVTEGANWRNRVTARSMLSIPFYRATRVAHRVQAPTLLMGGLKDSLVSIDDLRILAGRLPGSVLREYDCNHFQPYFPPLFDDFVREQADFLVQNLLPTRLDVSR